MSTSRDYRSYSKAHPTPPSQEKEWMNSCNFGLIDTAEELKKVLHSNLGATHVSVDTETEGLNPLKDKIAGICFSYDGVNGYYIPLYHKIGNNAPAEEVKQLLLEYWKDKSFIFFNYRFED